VNLIGSGRPTTGVERYIKELLPRLLEQEPEGMRMVLLTEAGDLSIPGIEPDELEARRVALPVRLLGPASRHLAIQLLLPAVLHRAGVSTLYSPMNVPTVAWRSQLVVLHDLSWRRFPSAYRTSYRAIHAGLLHASRRRRFPLIAVSEAVAAELRAELPDNPVRVVHSGPGMTSRRAFAPAARSGPRNRVLWVGTMQPRKGLPDAINACAGAARKLGRPLTLIAAGGQGPSFRDEQLPAHPQVEVDLVRRPSDDDLDSLYRGCDALLFTSRYEGFGFPVYEALVRGLPVVSSDLSPLREVALEGARLVPAKDVDAFASALSEELARPVPSATAPPHVSWENCAAQTWGELVRVTHGAAS